MEVIRQGITKVIVAIDLEVVIAQQALSQLYHFMKLARYYSSSWLSGSERA